MSELSGCVPAWLTRVYNAMCHPKALEDASGVLALVHPRSVPSSLRESCDVQRLPRPADCREDLHAVVDREVAGLIACGVRVFEECEGPGLKGAADLALVLRDPLDARLFLRYHAEARTTFHRSYAALVKALDRDAAEEGDSPNEATDDLEVSPNEATRGDGADATPATQGEPRESPDVVAAVEPPNEATSDVTPDAVCVDASCEASRPTRHTSLAPLAQGVPIAAVAWAGAA